MKKLEMDIEQCMDCPLYEKSIDKDGRHNSFWYCGHIDSPEDHIIAIAPHGKLRFEQLETMPEWCPLPTIIDTEEKFVETFGGEVNDDHMNEAVEGFLNRGPIDKDPEV